MPSTLVVLVLLTAIAAPQADSPAASATAKADTGRLALRAFDARTGGPLEGVSVFYQGRFDGKYRKATVSTDKAGEVVITWTPGAKVESLNFTATKPKFVPVHVNWRGDKRDLTLPSEKDLRFEPGVTIGGIVKDEAGGPIAGATVTVYSPPTESDQANYAFQIGSPKTGKDGRWHLDEAPANLAELWMSVEHSAFREVGGKPTRNLDSVIVLIKGLSVSGVVTDGEGRPVKGAKAIVGHDIWGSPEKPNAKTDDQGRFTIVNCEAGSTIVTVQAEGFAPQILAARIGDQAEPLAFHLEKGAVLRARVVDVKGKPVAGAFFAPDTWRGHRSIMHRKDTDDLGLYEWRSAPPDAVLYDVGKQGYMSRRNIPLTAAEDVQTVTLYPLLVVSGRVNDAKTGKPLQGFRVVQGRRFGGQEQVYWQHREAVPFRDGRYKVTFHEPSDALFVRVEAPGYQAADSRPFKPDEGEQTLDFTLERIEGSTGVVLLPDGKPARGVEVAVGTKESRITLHSGRFERDLNAAIATTGDDGLFQFSPPGSPFLLVVTGEAGFADITSDEFTKSAGVIELQPWGKLEGTVTIGGKPGADQPVAFLLRTPERDGGFGFHNYQYTTQTDGDGKFAFDRVAPGMGTVARVFVTEFGGGASQHMYGWQEPVDIFPGATARVRIGGKGRPVVGRMVVDGPPGATVDWLRNVPVTVTAPRGGVGGGSSYFANPDKDGRFRIDDVPAGRYDLSVTANGPRLGRAVGPGPEIGNRTMPLEVTEVPGVEPVDLGDIAVKVAKP